jgi:hypothetical protein
VKVLIVTSCTGEKAVDSEGQLMLEDFRKGPAHVARREKGLKPLLRPAREMYAGQQHVRLMRGIVALGASHDIDLRILSAGYGLIAGDRVIAPYETTFAGMKTRELREWADRLDAPMAFRAALAVPFDLGLVLLGDSYLEAVRLDDRAAPLVPGGPVILFCGGRQAKALPRLPGVRTVPLTNADARRFSCGLVGLKGELAARLLERLAGDPALLGILTDAATDLHALLEGASVDTARSVRATARPNQKVDFVISIPKSWWDKPHRQKLRYFIPEWDDLVDPGYDFENDVHSGGRGDWSTEVYAHQMYPEPNYDGILISKVVAEKSKKKKERINQLGVHRFLRVPREFPIMGDCGAFGYINEKAPPYTTEEILDYYSRLDFDFGVSIDHLIVTATEAEKKDRYDLTVENAAEFLQKHRKAKLPWTPIGAVQGWDAKSYAAAAKQYVSMGYEYIGLGGLVRTPTVEILEVLQKVHEVVPASVQVHLFGLARLKAMSTFASLGVRSVDSASFLRRAWMGSGGQNYLTLNGEFFTAIRIPETGKSFRAKRIVSEERASSVRVTRLEKASIEVMRDFDRGLTSVEKVLDTLEEYDRLITPDRLPHRHLLQRTLEARPWKQCPCDICRKDGIHVLIFRGNNRNRRRGFHNTYVFYRLLQQSLAADHVVAGGLASKGQLALFDGDQSRFEQKAVDGL